MRRSVLFFDVGSSGFLPLIDGILARGLEPIVNHPAMVGTLEAAKLPFRSWGEFVPPMAARIAEERATELVNGLAERLKSKSVLNAFASRYGNFVLSTGQEFFATLASLVANEVAVIETFERLCSEVELGLVVFGCNNNHTARALIGAARERKVPTLQLEHAISNEPMARIAGQTTTVFADYAAHFGPRAERFLTDLRNDPSKLVSTGAPLWDPLYRDRCLPNQKLARRTLGLDPERPVALLCTQYSEGVTTYFAAECRRRIAIHEAVARATSSSPQRPQLIVRPHPHEIRSVEVDAGRVQALDLAYRSWLGRKGFTDVHLIRDRKFEAIAAADLVFVEDESCVIPEIMILGRPVVMLPRFGKGHVYSERDGILIAQDQDIPEILEQLLSRAELREDVVQRQRRALPFLNESGDGHATERVVELIVKIAGSWSPG